MQQHDQSEHRHHHHSGTGVATVTSHVLYEQGNVIIHVTNENGDSPTLQSNHSKQMHLIIVSEDLEEYHHVHPIEQGDGSYTSKLFLQEGHYKAFVDISPAEGVYHISPHEIVVGNANEPRKANLRPTESKTVISGEVTATAQYEDPIKGDETVFAFELTGGKPEPYLGARGHVVILDEAAETFIHVHPLSDNETKFATSFDIAGPYKLWAEFKIDGEIHVFAYVIYVKEKEAT